MFNLVLLLLVLHTDVGTEFACCSGVGVDIFTRSHGRYQICHDIHHRSTVSSQLIPYYMHDRI